MDDIHGGPALLAVQASHAQAREADENFTYLVELEVEGEDEARHEDGELRVGAVDGVEGGELLGVVCVKWWRLLIGWFMREVSDGPRLYIHIHVIPKYAPASRPSSRTARSWGGT